MKKYLGVYGKSDIVANGYVHGFFDALHGAGIVGAPESVVSALSCLDEKLSRQFNAERSGLKPLVALWAASQNLKPSDMVYAVRAEVSDLEKIVACLPALVRAVAMKRGELTLYEENGRQR